VTSRVITGDCREVLRTLDAGSVQQCDCCKRLVPHVRGSMWHGHSRICLACFYVWYDPSDGIDVADPAQVAAAVHAAEAAGTYPFGGTDDGDNRLIRRVLTRDNGACQA
jgi:hypothetical protein